MKPFESGDRVAFFGDSLTHAGSYHRFIRNYYFTRYPGIDLKTFNCGNGGDSARGALFRMDFDLFNFQPNKVYVLFGMNDVDRYCYGTDHPDPQNLANREAALKIYAESMETLVRRLQDAEMKEIVLISPTPYEEEAVMEEVNLKGTFRALHRCMEINERLAERYGCSTVDLLNPMLELNRRMRETDPSASLAGPDRVHPTTLGHAVMAYWILRAQKVPKNVFSVTLGLAPTMENCAVSDLQMDGENLQFHLLPFSMPDSDDSMISIKTMPLAPSRAVCGNRNICKRPDTNAVRRIPARRVRLPYRSSRGGPTTSSISIFPKK